MLGKTALGRKGPWHCLGSVGTSFDILAVAWVFRSSCSALVFPVGLTGRNDTTKGHSQSAAVCCPALGMLKPRAPGLTAHFHFTGAFALHDCHTAMLE